MQSDVWYELALRDLTGTENVVLELLRDAQAAQGAPDDQDAEAEADSPAT